MTDMMDPGPHDDPANTRQQSCVLTSNQCAWVRMPDVSVPPGCFSVRFYIPCIGEVAKGVHALYPDDCPHCGKRVRLVSFSVEKRT